MRDFISSLGSTGGRGRQHKRKVIVAGIAVLILLMWVAMYVAFIHTASNADKGHVLDQGADGASTKKQHSKTALTTIQKHRAINSAGGYEIRCADRKDCLGCLFPASRGGNAAFEHSFVARGDCVWCASDAACVPAAGGNASSCDDVESAVCPAILLTPTPQTHRVIHVGIRKGGPEALVQLHLALNHWGFNTTLDTRHSKKEKGGPVMPFFLEAYREEFSKAPPLRWVKNYDAWHDSSEEGDVMIATETWACKADSERYLPRGVRQFQWHLTVWPRRDRSQCTIAGHTNYVARDYMRQSVRSLMYPYISPHIIQLAQSKSTWRKHKKDLVLYDSDAKLKDSDLESRRGVARIAKIATGYTPQQLYELYGQAKAGIDLQLPGGERFVYEAALFDVCVIVDDALNGADHEDFPVPDRFRVKPNNLDALNAAVDECIKDYDRVIQEFEPLKQLVLRQKVTFLRQVRRYFSNSVHIVTQVCSQAELDVYGVRFLIQATIQVPFTVIEFMVPRGVKLTAAAHKVLLDNSLLAAVFFSEFDPKSPFGDICSAANPSSRVDGISHRLVHLIADSSIVVQTNMKRSLITAFMPLHVVILSDDIIHFVASQLVLQRRHSLSSLPFVSIEVSNSGEGTVVYVPLVAVFTADLSRWRASCSVQDLSQSPQLLVSSTSASKITAPLLLPTVEKDRLAELAAIVVEGAEDGGAKVQWGSQQALDESVLPLFCTHELWRRLVAEAKTDVPLFRCA